MTPLLTPKDHLAELTDYLNRLLEGGKDRAQEDLPKSPTLEGIEASGLVDPAGFEARIKDLVAGRVLNADVQFIGLSRLPPHFGDRWPAVAERVTDIANSVIGAG